MTALEAQLFEAVVMLHVAHTGRMKPVHGAEGVERQLLKVAAHDKARAAIAAALGQPPPPMWRPRSDYSL